MPFRFTLLFDGVCAFVPATDRRSMTILLVNALDGAHANFSHSGYSQAPGYCHTPNYGCGHAPGQGHVPACRQCIPPHYPYISFDMRRLWKPRPDVVVETTGGPLGIRFFDWDHMTIQDVEPTGLYIANGRRPGSAEPLNAAETEDFSWLVEVQKVDPEIGEIDPRCLAPDPPRNRVIGRVFLDQGRILTNRVAQVDSRTLLWEFVTADGAVTSPVCQALAQTIAWRTQVNGEYVRLRFSPFNGARYTDYYFYPDPETEELEIGVSNLPLDRTLRLDGTSYDPINHFSLLYRVANVGAVRPYVPSVVPRPGVSRPTVTGVAAGSTICIGGSFSGG